MHPIERRHHARRPLRQPAKLRCEQAPGRYFAATTHDVSAGGAQLRMHDAPHLAAGQRVRLGIAHHPRQAILTSHTMVDATIIRSLAHGSACHIAVRFDRPITLALAG